MIFEKYRIVPKTISIHEYNNILGYFQNKEHDERFVVELFIVSLENGVYDNYLSRVVLCLYDAESKELIKISRNQGSFKMTYYPATGTDYFGYVREIDYDIHIAEIVEAYVVDYSIIFNKIKELIIGLDTSRKQSPI